MTTTPDEKDNRKLYNFLEHLSDQARMLSLTEFHVLNGEFEIAAQKAPAEDINIFGLEKTSQLDFIREIPDLTKSSSLFVKDSGHESALV